MPYYQFPLSGQLHEDGRASAFCVANQINPRAILFGSTFEVTDDGVIITHEFELNGNARVMHDRCCGSSHYAKHTGRHAMLAKPEDYGFEALRTSDGSVAP